MKRPGGLFWIAIAFAAGIGNYAVKQMVQGLDDQLNNVRKKTIAEQKQIHDLTAEWTYLNQPELLADLNRRYLGLVAIAPKQRHAGIDDLPLRPVPPAEAAPPPAQLVSAVIPAPAAALPAPMPVARNVPAAAAAASLAPQPAAPERPRSPASLDAIFAQVAGDR